MTTEKFWRHMGMNPNRPMQGDVVLTTSLATALCVGDDITVYGGQGYCRGTFKITAIKGSTIHLHKDAWWRRVLRTLNSIKARLAQLVEQSLRKA